MKTKIVYIAFVFMIITLFSSCTNNSSKAPNYAVSEEKTESYQETKSSTTSNDDEIICEAIAAFLKQTYSIPAFGRILYLKSQAGLRSHIRIERQEKAKCDIKSQHTRGG